jgi:hypothetical protein
MNDIHDPRACMVVARDAHRLPGLHCPGCGALVDVIMDWPLRGILGLDIVCVWNRWERN